MLAVKKENLERGGSVVRQQIYTRLVFCISVGTFKT